MWRNGFVNESHVREVRTLRINLINVVYIYVLVVTISKWKSNFFFFHKSTDLKANNHIKSNYMFDKCFHLNHICKISLFHTIFRCRFFGLYTLFIFLAVINETKNKEKKR